MTDPMCFASASVIQRITRVALILVLLATGIQGAAPAEPASTTVLARPLDAPRPAFDVRAWDSDTGLPQNTVRAIVQARDGHMWIGTSEGLARFDGSEFTVFSRISTPGFLYSPITALLEGPQGEMWVASDGSGIARLEGRQVARISSHSGLSSPRVFALAPDKDGSIWLATAKGLNRLKDGRITVITENEGLARDVVHSLHRCRSGDLLVGTSRGLTVIRGSSVVPDPLSEIVGRADVRLVYEDASGDRWIVTGTRVIRQHAGAVSRYEAGDGFLPQKVETLTEDHAGTLWFGTVDGLYRFDQGRFVAAPWKGATGHESIRAICEDREGNLWVGTNDGLKQCTRAPFVPLTMDEGLSHDAIASVCQDASGAYWVGTMAGGLNFFSGSTRKVYGKRDGLLSDGIRALCAAREGGVWAGFDRSGVVRIKDGEITRFTSGAFNGSIAQALYEDRRGTLWIGTRRGLCSLKGGKVTNHLQAGEVPVDTIRDFAAAPEGGLWLATADGLLRFQDGRVAMRYGPAEGLRSGSLRSLYLDGDGVLWIGTTDGGLNWLRDGRLGGCSVAEGLPNNTILDLIDDKCGNLWMLSRQGIFRAEKRELLELGTGQRKRINCIAYSKADGLPAPEASSVAKPAAWRSADGRLWFATIKGLARTDPARLTSNAVPPPVVITRLRVDGADLPFTSGVQLPPGDGELEFHYAALSFTQPEKIRFKYLLEGVNERWVDAGPRKVASYSRVPPGRHRFRVQAMNNDGVWNETGATLEFHLAPRFYQTWWFYAAVGLLTVSGTVGGYVVRVRAIEGRERRLIALVDERTAHLQKEIREHELTEQALQRSESLYASLVEVLPLSIYRRDNDGRLTFANENYCRRIGRTAPEVVGKTPEELAAPGLARRIRAIDQEVLTSRSAVHCEVEQDEPNGGKRWFETVTVPVIDGTGAVLGVQGLSSEITARKQAELRVAEAQRELLEVSRQAGMAEIATGVLHNVGNVLNSVNVSATLVIDKVRASRSGNLGRLAELLQANEANLATFFASDPRASVIPAFVANLAKQLADDEAQVIAELNELRKNIDHIKTIVVMQQDYARVSGVTETVKVSEVVEDALRIAGSSLDRHGISLRRDYRADAFITVEKHKVMQVLVNLIENAKHACTDSKRSDATISIGIARESGRVIVRVVDNGVGIAPENLTRIFAHGFTTRANGHGFGLHCSALVASELGGELTGHSDGVGHGAEFVLVLPLRAPAAQPVVTRVANAPVSAGANGDAAVTDAASSRAGSRPATSN